MTARTPVVCLVLALAGAASALACEPAAVPMPERIRDAEGIFVGYVTGEHLAGYEAEVLDGNPDAIPMWGERRVRVVPVEILRGEPAPFVQAAVACGSPVPELFERAIVLQSSSGAWVGPARVFESDLRKELGGGTGHVPSWTAVPDDPETAWKGGKSERFSNLVIWLASLLLPLLIFVTGNRFQSFARSFAQALVAIGAGWVLNVAYVTAAQAIYVSGASQEEVLKFFHHDGAPRAFAMVFGWVPAAVVVAATWGVQLVAARVRSRTARP